MLMRSYAQIKRSYAQCISQTPRAEARLSARLGAPFLTMIVMVHIALLLYHYIYSYKLIFKLKDPIETPMAQQVCSRMFL